MNNSTENYKGVTLQYGSETIECGKCAGTGFYATYGKCFQCAGKGQITPKDHRRNAVYNHEASQRNIAAIVAEAATRTYAADYIACGDGEFVVKNPHWNTRLADRKAHAKFRAAMQDLGLFVTAGPRKRKNGEYAFAAHTAAEELAAGDDNDDALF